MDCRTSQEPAREGPWVFCQGMWSCGGWCAQRASTVDQSPLCRVIVPRQGEGDAKLRWVLMGTTPASLQGLTCRGQRPTLPLPQSPPMHTDGAPQGPSKLAAEKHHCHLVGSGTQGITELISGYISVWTRSSGTHPRGGTGGRGREGLGAGGWLLQGSLSLSSQAGRSVVSSISGCLHSPSWTLHGLKQSL